MTDDTLTRGSQVNCGTGAPARDPLSRVPLAWHLPPSRNSASSQPRFPSRSGANPISSRVRDGIRVGRLDSGLAAGTTRRSPPMVCRSTRSTTGPWHRGAYRSSTCAANCGRMQDTHLRRRPVDGLARSRLKSRRGLRLRIAVARRHGDADGFDSEAGPREGQTVVGGGPKRRRLVRQTRQTPTRHAHTPRRGGWRIRRPG